MISKRNTIIHPIFFLFLLFFSNNLFSVNQHKVDSLELLLQKELKDTSRLRILYELSFEIGCFDKGKSGKYKDEAKKLVEEGNLDLNADLLYKTGIMYSGFEADYFNTIKYYKLSAERFQQEGNIYKALIVNNRLAYLYYYIGEYKRAVEIYLYNIENAKNYNELLKDAYYFLAWTYINLEDYKNALFYAHEYLDFSEIINNKKDRHIALQLIGNIFLDKNDYKQALEYHLKALKIRTELKDDFYVANSYSVIAQDYFNLEEFEKCISYQLKAIDIYTKHYYVKEIVRSSIYISNAYKTIEKYKEALEYLNSSIDYLNSNFEFPREFNVKAKFSGIYSSLTDIYEKKGNFKKAFEYQTLYSLYADSVKNDELNIKYVEMHNKNEREKKQRELEKLSEQNEIQKLQINKNKFIIIGLSVGFLLVIIIALMYIKQNKLRTDKKVAEMQQTALTRQMNPHFIFNTINSIQRFILQNDKLSSNKYLIKFARLMRLVLENSQNNIVTVKDEVDALNLYLELESLRFKNKFDYQINVDNNSDILSCKIPNLLIQPFVENAIWHGIMHKEGKGNININLKYNKENICCKIEDNGIGRKKAYEIKNRQIGTHKSMGIKITKKRLDLISYLYASESNIEYFDYTDENNKPSGTGVEINIPIMN